MYCVLSLVLALTGCATMGANYRPIVDVKDVDMNKLEGDLSDCRQYAGQVGGAGEAAAAGALAGALFGALLAPASGVKYDRSSIARIGALSGAVSGAAEGEKDQRNIFEIAWLVADIEYCNEL